MTKEEAEALVDELLAAQRLIFTLYIETADLVQFINETTATIEKREILRDRIIAALCKDETT